MTKKTGFKSMKGRLTFWLLMIALLPLSTVAVITSYQRYHAIKVREFSKLVAIRDLKVDQVNQWFQEREGDVRTISEDLEIRDLETQIQKNERYDQPAVLMRARNLLKRYLNNYTDYSELFIVNPLSGRIDISTDPSSEGEDRSGDAVFTVPLKTGRLYIQDIYYSRSLNMPSMAFSIPVLNAARPENVAGILVARIDLNQSLYALLLNRTGMGTTGETLIVDEHQTALNPLRWHENAPLRLKIAAEPAALAAAGKSGIIEAEDYRGVPVLAAYTFIPATGWGFVAKEDLAEAYAPIYGMFRDIGLLFVLAAAGVYGLALFLARTIARPVREMAGVSRKIEGGDLKARNHIESRDELGVLAESFNSMAASLALHAELRQVNDDITRTLVNAKDLSEFRINIVKKLVRVTDSQMGVYFLLNRETRMFEPFFSIGMDSDLLKSYDASRLEGELGMVVEKKQITRITDIPEDSIFKFKTFTGDLLPKEIISIPMTINSMVSGVVSLASIKPYPRKVLEIMEQPWTSGFGTALANMWANEETARLAKELKSANQKLQAQAEELQAQNEELESQSEELRHNAEELQEQNLELEAQKEQVESANRLKSEFLSNMSHELRTPLNSVMALSRVLTLQAKDKLSEEERSYLEIIERNGRNLLSLINDILDLSKIEAGRMDIHPKPLSVISTIETILEQLEPIAREKNIQLRHELTEDLPRIESDEARVQQILQNLIANAVKFTQEGSVAITGSTDGDHISIKISDTGIGIPKKDLPHIFEEFRQVDGSTARPYEGTGLGLTIVHKTAQLLGGEVTVESLLGKGSTFTLTLPVKGRRVKPVSEPLTLKPAAGVKRSRPVVLVIDDEPQAATVISNYLSREGYAVMTATSGKDGVRLARKHRPFAITLDIIMPDMDGWEVLQELKQHPETKDIPVIVVSISHDRETGMALGAVGFITKPVNQARLMAEIRSIDGPAPHTVLIVDDDALDRQEMARMVTEEGMDTVVAENGAQCMERLKEALPDVMVLDLMMPEVDGFEVLRRVRSDPDVQAVPVIVVTAKDLTDEDRAQLSGNVFSVLTKSDTTSKTLLEQLKRLLSELKGAPPAVNTPQR
ncbi:MAG: response regulator, partial [Deltaproteobacteria bacterium]|nr:response regulator [Deltaproteobacteria bacterium]